MALVDGGPGPGSSAQVPVVDAGPVGLGACLAGKQARGDDISAEGVPLDVAADEAGAMADALPSGVVCLALPDGVGGPDCPGGRRVSLFNLEVLSPGLVCVAVVSGCNESRWIKAGSP